MIASFENKFNFTENENHMPFMVENMVIGHIINVNKDFFSVYIYDKYIGVELYGEKPFSVYLSKNEQLTAIKGK